MFTHPRPVNDSTSETKPTLAAPPVWEYPLLLIKSVKVVCCLPFYPRLRRLADAESTSSFGRHVLCLAHWSGQRYGGGDREGDRIWVDSSTFCFVYNKLYLMAPWTSV